MLKHGFGIPIDFLNVVVRMRDLFVPYFNMSIFFIQCAKKLLTGKRARSRFWAAFDSFLNLIGKHRWRLFRFV